MDRVILFAGESISAYMYMYIHVDTVLRVRVLYV